MVDKGTVWLEDREGGEVGSKMRLQKEAGASPGQASEARSECLKINFHPKSKGKPLKGYGWKERRYQFAFGNDHFDSTVPDISNGFN